MALAIKWNVNNRSLKLLKKKNCLHAFWFYELGRVFWEAFILINKATVIYGRCFQNIGVIQSCSILCDLMEVTMETVTEFLFLGSTRLLCPWNSPNKNTGVSSHFPLQGIFLTQELNPGLPHCKQILYQLNYQGSPKCA